MGAWMTCVPQSSSLSPPRPPQWTRTGEKRNLLRPRRAATPCSPGLWSAWSWPCRDSTDNRGLWSNETAVELLSGQLPSFLTLLDHGPCHTNSPFSMTREQSCDLPPFSFSQRVPGARGSASVLQLSVGTLFIPERILTQKSFVPRDFFLPSFAFMLQN